MDLKVCVVLPAAGSGERMNISTPKQFCKVRDRPIIMHTIDAFDRIPWVFNIIIPTSQERQGYMTELCQSHDKVKVTQGGTTRHRSIQNGVKMVEQVLPDCDVVIIHDGVRPLIEDDLLNNIVRAAYKHGAAGVVRPLVSTVISTDPSGFLDTSLDRSLYHASEMPQAFRYHIICKAYQQCTPYDLEYGTECLYLAQKYAGSKVKILDGPDYLWKITHKKDLYAFEAILKEKDQHSVCLLGFENSSSLTESTMTECLNNSQINVSTELCSSTSCAILCLDPLETADSLVSQCNNLLVCDIRPSCIMCLTNVESSDELSQANVRLHEVLQELEKIESSENMVYYGIVVQNKQSEKLAGILTTLIQERNSAFSGQVFQVS